MRGVPGEGLFILLDGVRIAKLGIPALRRPGPGIRARSFDFGRDTRQQIIGLR